MTKNIKLLKFGWAYSLPFVGVMVVNHLILGKQYFSTKTDTVQSELGKGLNWLALEPILSFHHPGYFFHQLGAILLLLTGLPQENLSAFNAAGIGLNVLVLIGSTVWVAHLAQQLQLRVMTVLALALLAATMPTMMLYQDLWSVWYPSGLLAIPAVLAIYGLVGRAANRYHAVFWPFFVLGFLSGNLILGVTIALSALLGLLAALPLRDTQACAAQLGLQPPPKFLTPLGGTLLFCWLLSLEVALVGAYFAKSPLGLVLPVAIAVNLGAIAGVVLLVRKLSWFRLLFQAFFVPLAAGWAVGANVLLPYWGTSLTKILAYNNSGPDSSPLINRVSHLQVLPFLAHSVWHLALVLAGVAGLIAGFQVYRQRQFSRGDRPQTAFTAVLVLTGLALNLAIAAPVTLVAYDPWVEAQYLGQISRYYTFMIAILAVVLVWLAQTQRSQFRPWVLGFALAIGLVSGWQYTREMAPIVAHRNQVNQELQTLVQDYLRTQPHGTVFCVRTVLPEACGVLYGYNNYRTHLSLKQLHQSSLLGGRIRYGDRLETVLNQTHPGPALLILETTPIQPVPPFQEVWHDALTRMVLWQR